MYSHKILSEFNLKIKIAGEIEFYIEPAFASEDIENAFLAQLLFNLTRENIKIWQLNKEVSPNQYEVALQPNIPEIAAAEIVRLKEIINDTANNIPLSLEGRGQGEGDTARTPHPDPLPQGARGAVTRHKALFHAKPYENLPGCGLHIHIGIDDMNGNSVMQRPGERGSRGEESEIMQYAIGGLCATMLKNFIHFAPTEESYLRFCAKRNELENVQNPLATHNNAPINVSWGGNNRTTAIRIPVSSYDESTRHIEHRVSGSDADPQAVINAVLEGIYIGIKEKISPPEKIYGNAFDKQYDFLKPFPKTLEEAKGFIL